MAATKLRLYRDAARLLADARFALITDDVETRYALDDAWDEAVAFVLRQAAWRFALRTVTLVPGGTALSGYTLSYLYPTNWLRTHAIFLVTSDGRECPIDLREEGAAISVNIGAPRMRYVANEYLDPAAAAWPEHFAQCVAAYLAFLVAYRVTGNPGAAAEMSQLFSSLLPEAVRIDANPEDRWLPHQRSGDMLRAARELLRQGFWRFALKVAAASAGGTPAAGYSNAFTQPADWLRTRTLYTSSAGREFPFDVREHGGQWSANIAAFNVQYVSSTLGLDSTLWREGFMKALLAFLEADAAHEKEGGLYPALLAAALQTEADAPDKWLAAQLDGTFLRAARSVLGAGYWAFRGSDGTMVGLKEVQIDSSSQLTTTPDYGFPYRYGLPDDWFRTHSLFVPWDGQECPINIRQSAHDWSTDAASFVARYVSTDVLTATTWPEIVADAVFARIMLDDAPADVLKARQAEYDRLLAEALALHSREEDPWLRFQLGGSFRQATQQLLESGRWRFAKRTVSLTPSSDALPAELSDGTVSDSYGYRFIRPNDLIRTIWVYYLVGSGTSAQRVDIDYRDEGGAYHANYTPITVRYVSRLGLDSTKWTANFRAAVHACCLHLEAPTDAKLRATYEAAEGRAEGLDDARDMPPMRNVGRFVAARYGRSSVSREQGWPPWP
jgi:hypothetical protein